MVKVIALTGIAFELNAKYTSPVFLKEVLGLCRTYDPVVSICSDVHDLAQLGNSMRMLREAL